MGPYAAANHIFNLSAIGIKQTSDLSTSINRGGTASTGQNAVEAAVDERRDMVEVDAQFYRVVRYQNAKGLARDVPYLLARTLRVVPEERRSLFDFTDPMNLAMVVALGAVVIWGTLRVVSSRKPPRVQWRAPRSI